MEHMYPNARGLASHAPLHVQRAIDSLCADMASGTAARQPAGVPAARAAEGGAASAAKAAVGRLALDDFTCSMLRLVVALVPLGLFVVALLSPQQPQAGQAEALRGAAAGAAANSTRSGTWDSETLDYKFKDVLSSGACSVTSSPLPGAFGVVFVLHGLMRCSLGWGDATGWQKVAYYLSDVGSIVLMVCAGLDYAFPQLIMNRWSLLGVALFLACNAMKDSSWDEAADVATESAEDRWRRFACRLADLSTWTALALGTLDWLLPGFASHWLPLLGVGSVLVAHGPWWGDTETVPGGYRLGALGILVRQSARHLAWFTPVVAMADRAVPGISSDLMLQAGSALLLVGVQLQALRAPRPRSAEKEPHGRSCIGSCCGVVAVIVVGLGQLLLAMVVVDWTVADILEIHLLELILAAMVAIGGTWMASLPDESPPSGKAQPRVSIAEKMDPKSPAGLSGGGDEVSLVLDLVGLWPYVFFLTAATLSAGVLHGI